MANEPVRACPATINVNGTEVRCELESGRGHNPENGFAHKGNLDNGPDGLEIEWSLWRRVKPPRV